MDLGKFVDEVAKRAEDNTVVNEGDYEKDGLLYCGKCNTPKQVKIEILGQVKTPFCLCKCAAEQRDAEDRAFKEKQKSDEIKRLRNTGFLDSAEMKSWNFENADDKEGKLLTVASNYVKNFADMKAGGKGLLLFGGVGTGKTYAAACIANALIDQGRPCYMTNFSKLANTLSGKFEGKQEFIDSLNRYDLLVIDDLATERNTDYMNEIVFNFIDSRYRAKKPLIVTTNLTADEISKATDFSKKRIFSRLYDMCIPLEVNGEDRRRANLRKDYVDYKEKLGL